MRHNIILLATLAILSMVVFSHTAISCPQIASSELIRPNCRDALYCEASSISENAKNMYCADGTIKEAFLDFASGSLIDLNGDQSLISFIYSVLSLVLDGLIIIAAFMPFASLIPFDIKLTKVLYQWTQWKRVKLMKTDIRSRVLTKVRGFVKGEPADSILSVNGLILYRDLRPKVDLNIYLLKEAFKELERYPEILEDRYFYDFATLFLLETVQRAAFMKIPTDRKVYWLMNRYIADVLIGDEVEHYDKKNLINGHS